MKAITLLFCFSIFAFSFAQKTSDVVIHSGKANDITISQTGADTSQSSSVSLEESDSNLISVVQTDTNKESSTTGFMQWIKDSKDVIQLISLVLGIPLAIFALYSMFKGRKKAKK